MKNFSNHWKKWADFSNHWKKSFQSLENLGRVGSAQGWRRVGARVAVILDKRAAKGQDAPDFIRVRAGNRHPI
ncbi:MAG: hypothetical protein IKQ55_11640 [Kiritimatiellae bacterium]|nr:hypothetical protein [Kiritimatiellia bacterium]